MRWLRLCLRRAASNAQIIRVFILFVNREDANKRLKKSKRAGYNCPSSSIAFVIGRHETACEVGYKMDVGCETDLRAVRDGFR